MGYSSQAGQLLICTQTTQGTFEPTFGTKAVGIKLKSGSFGTNRDLLIPDPEIGGGRDTTDAYLGAVSWSGDFDFYCRVDGLATLLYGALGIKAAPVTLTGVTTHTITPSDAAQLPFFSVEEAVGNGLEVFNYTDVVINTLHIESEANGYFSGTVGLVGAKQIAGATKTASPLWDATPLIVGTNIVVNYNSVALPAKSFSLDINNNYEDDDYRLGSLYIGDLTPKGREVTASFNIREASSAMWRQATYGASAAVAPGGTTVKAPLTILASTYENIPASTPPTPYSVGFTIPSFILSPYSFSVSGSDIIEDDIEGRALRPVFATPIATVVVKMAKLTVS